MPLKIFLITTFLFFIAFFPLYAGPDKQAEADSISQHYYKKYLGFIPDEQTSLKLLDRVIDWLGTPYRYGGKSENGIDCSGFVTKIYESAFHLDLPGTSRSMFSQVKKVEKDKLQQGDLIFFKTRNNRISHVGIYLKDNKFVHASSKRGIVVNDLNESYYKQKFFAAGRPVSLINSLRTLQLLTPKPFKL